MAIPYVVRKKADLTSGEEKSYGMVYQVKYRIEAEYRTKNLLKWWSCGEVSTVVRLKAYWWK